ncbi:hypothetical protein GCM10011314_22980 [Knoellia flava]|uniref:Uncharacterized protein n=1 Tax=Knoellia flava TaxID=913969 RepID=A0A8H9FUD5_9MICO|nr:hypothetical protein GCM10011314_22980 [Knoellia flava]
MVAVAAVVARLRCRGLPAVVVGAEAVERGVVATAGLLGAHVYWCAGSKVWNPGGPLRAGSRDRSLLRSVVCSMRWASRTHRGGASVATLRPVGARHTDACGVS